MSDNVSNNDGRFDELKSHRQEGEGRGGRGGDRRGGRGGGRGGGGRGRGGGGWRDDNDAAPGGFSVQGDDNQAPRGGRGGGGGRGRGGSWRDNEADGYDDNRGGYERRGGRGGGRGRGGYEEGDREDGYAPRGGRGGGRGRGGYDEDGYAPRGGRGGGRGRGGYDEGARDDGYAPRGGRGGGRGRGGYDDDGYAPRGGRGGGRGRGGYDDDGYAPRGGRGGGRGRGRGGYDEDYDRPRNNRHADPTEGEEGEAAPAPKPAPVKRRTVRTGRYNRSKEEAEVAEMFERRHNQKGISFDNYNAISVDIAPKDIEPVTGFDDFHVEELLAANLERCGYQKPTPVQRYGIPVTLGGKDLMACAQTGSGKTAAFLIPVVQDCLVNGVSPAKHSCAYPIALIMAPTRELALQIFDEARKLCYQTDIFCDVAYGGTSYPVHFENDILVACPGRLKDLYDRSRCSFEKIKYLVLDEADRMLEMGFEEQIEYLVASRYTDMPGPEERQTMMYSATFPRRIQNLARSYLRKNYYLLTVGRVGSTTKNITQRVMWVESNDKRDRLMTLLYQQLQTDLVLVFVETKREAENLHSYLYREGIPSATIHGDRKQWEREEALASFKSGETPVLVATDVASRGLDIPNVSHVIQYDLPSSMDDYTHRIGRTGRAGNKGTATSLFNDRDTNLNEELMGYLREHDQEIPEWMESLSVDVAANAFGSAGGRGGPRRGGRGGRGGGRGRDDEGPGGRGGRGGAIPDARRGGGSAPKPRFHFDDGGF